MKKTAQMKPADMIKINHGAVVRYCGHTAVFIADIYHIGGACVVRANGPVDRNLIRSQVDYAAATHHVIDHPVTGFWRPDLGVLVVPAAQVLTVKKG